MTLPQMSCPRELQVAFGHPSDCLAGNQWRLEVHDHTCPLRFGCSLPCESLAPRVRPRWPEPEESLRGRRPDQSAVAGMATRELRMLLQRAKATLSEVPGEFPLTHAAVNQLEAALRMENPQRKQGAKRRRGPDETKARKVWGQKVRRLQAKVADLAGQVAASTGSRGLRRQLDCDWLVRVALAAPFASARAMEVAFREVCDTDENIVSRVSIGKIQDAFAEVVKKMMFEFAAKTVAGAIDGAGDREGAFVNIVLTHLQDEAELRLRSFLGDRIAAPPRGRASKVQQHVATLFAHDCPTVVPTEMEALADKTAATLATSLEGVLRNLVKWVLPTGTRPETPVVFTHILVGDAISTNEAAAKVLLASVRRDPIAENTQYWLVSLRCATHQANLSCRSCVEGPAAACASDIDGPAKSKGAHTLVCGSAVRLFKYLLSDYHEEFCGNLREWVLQNLTVGGAELARQNDMELALGMTNLYGSNVFPDAVMRLWNNGLKRMEHIVPGGVDPIAVRPQVAGDLVAALGKWFMQVDERPTVSRFWSFRKAIDRMLAMHCFGFPGAVLRFKSIKPREQNQKRVRCVLSFFAHDETPQFLRRLCLTLQLTGAVTSLTGQEDKEGLGVPMLVRLFRGEAQSLVQAQLSKIFRSMVQDPDLQCGPAVRALFATALDLLGRFKQYQEYPYRLVLMCRRWNPDGYLAGAGDFLHEPRERLDTGYSLQLQRLAMDGRSPMDAIRFLTGTDVQEALELLFARAAVSTLEVERRHAHARKWEGSKLTHIATASRKCLLQRYARERTEQSRKFAKVAEEVRRVSHTNPTSLAWETQAEVRPAGVRFGHVQGPAPQAEARVNDCMRAEVRARKVAAKVAFDSLHAKYCMPVSRFDWRLWMQRNETEFRELMKTAPQERKKRSHRLQARADLPDPVSRLQPRVERWKPVAEWATILRGRCGWHGIRTSSGMHLVFLYPLRGDTLVLDLTGLRQSARETNFLLSGDFDILRHMSNMQELEGRFPGAIVAGVYALIVDGQPSLDGVRMNVRRGKLLLEPLARIARQRSAGADDESDETELEKEASSSEASGVSVDTDVDSDVLESDGVGSVVEAADVEPGSGDEGGEDAPAMVRVRREPLWSSPYFYILDNEGHPDVKIRMRDVWACDEHMGRYAMSRTLTPTHYGETRAAPARSLILLKAWALWRAGQKGWSSQRPGRARQFERDLVALEAEMRGVPGELLGNDAADALLRKWVPDLVARVAPR